MRAFFRVISVAIAFAVLPIVSAQAQNRPNEFSSNELVDAGHRFFGTVSRGLASVIERAVSKWGQPNGYILGQEGALAIVVFVL
jgi:hypothetical protein